MKKQSKSTLRRLCLVSGLSLLIAAVLMLGLWQWNIHTWQQRSQSCVQTLSQLIPQPRGAIPEERRDNTMPTLSLDGMDFVGILEMPRFTSSLPVAADWGKLTRCPARFDGSVYDGSLCIGCSSQKGQYDFYREISVGDTLFFTDMEGSRFSFAVSDIRYVKHADSASLQRTDAALTLFIKNVYAFEYIIIYCDVLS